MRLFAAIVTLVSLGALAAPAIAGPPASDKDPKVAARSLAEQGLALFEAGKYAEAIDALEQAERLFHAPTIVVALARVLAASGKLVEARAAFQRVIDEKLAPAAPPAFREAQRAAKQEIAAIEKRTPAMQIIALGGAGKRLRVTVDDREVEGWSPERFVSVNPGARRVAIIPAGQIGVSRAVDVKEGARLVVEIDVSPPPPSRVAAPPPPRDAPRPWLLPSIMGFGVAALGAGVGIGAGVATMKAASDLRARCGDVCAPTAANKTDVAAANGLGIASTVGFALAGAGVVTGVVLLVVKPGKRAPSAAVIDVGPGSIGVRGVY